MGAERSPPVAAGRVPRPVIAESARAVPPPASSRYLATNSGQVSRTGCTSRSLPKPTVTEAGPTSSVADPEKSGPQTRMVAPSEMLKLIVPRNVSILMPAEIRAYTITSNQNGSKYTMPCAPKATFAQMNPKSTLTSMSTPAIRASEVSAK